jgi:ERCC4-type nuclease
MPRIIAKPRKQGVLARNANGLVTQSHPSEGLVVVVDSREQTPWTFTLPTIVAGLPVGDYSIAGAEDSVALERKSLDDFVSSVTWNRERFWRSLEKLRAYRFGAVIVEASVADVLAGRYVSKAHPWAILTSALAISVDFGLPVIFAGNASDAARCAQWMLCRHVEKRDVAEGNSAARRGVSIAKSADCRRARRAEPPIKASPHLAPRLTVASGRGAAEAHPSLNTSMPVQTPGIVVGATPRRRAGRPSTGTCSGVGAAPRFSLVVPGAAPALSASGPPGAGVARDVTASLSSLSSREVTAVTQSNAEPARGAKGGS